MPTPDQDAHYMHRALTLARRGIALTAPNPAVGCAPFRPLDPPQKRPIASQGPPGA